MNFLYCTHRMRIGFTLIELLIVVAIIGILAAIAVPNFMRAQTKAKVAKTISELNHFSTILEQYFIDHQAYPPSPHPLIHPSAVAETWRLTMPVAYISRIPHDPFYAQKFSEESNGARLNRGGPFGIDSQYLHYINDPLLGEYWVVFSYGPDQDMENVEVHYDATNGTVSNGDIYQVGYPRE